MASSRQECPVQRVLHVGMRCFTDPIPSQRGSGPALPVCRGGVEKDATVTQDGERAWVWAELLGSEPCGV